MANKVIKYESFYRGETPVFAFTFTSPSDGFDWDLVSVDAAMTNQTAPSNNSGAAVLRTGETLDVDEDNTATFEMQPPPVESEAFVPGKYKIQVSLTDGGGANVIKPLTGEVTVLQDYII